MREIYLKRFYNRIPKTFFCQNCGIKQETFCCCNMTDLNTLFKLRQLKRSKVRIRLDLTLLIFFWYLWMIFKAPIFLRIKDY